MECCREHSHTLLKYECEINMPLDWECFNISVCVLMCVCVCALFIGTATLHVCMCVSFLLPSTTTVIPKAKPKSLVTIYCSHCFFLFAKPPSQLTRLPFLTNLKAPQWPLQAVPPSPTNYWSSFILLRAEPAWNHSICVSLKLWLRVKDSWLPSLCLITAIRG